MQKEKIERKFNLIPNVQTVLRPEQCLIMKVQEQFLVTRALIAYIPKLQHGVHHRHTHVAVMNKKKREMFLFDLNLNMRCQESRDCNRLN